MGHVWYKQAISENNNLYKIVCGEGGHLSEEYFLYFNNDNLEKIETRVNNRFRNQSIPLYNLDEFLHQYFNKGFLDDVHINPEWLNTKLLKNKLPGMFFYKLKKKTHMMEYSVVEGMLAINSKKPIASQIYYNPNFNGENKEFWQIFYNIEVREFEQAEVSREILELFKQVFFYEIIPLVSHSKNVVSYMVYQNGGMFLEYDFYFENNKLQKIMRGWENDKYLLK